MHTYYFEKLDVWKGAKELAIVIYKITENFPVTEKFILTDQLKRSVLSISSNIAEGSTREHSKEQSRFLNISYGSSIEVLNHILIAKELGYVNDGDVENIRMRVSKITNQLRALNNSIRSKNQSDKKTQPQ